MRWYLMFIFILISSSTVYAKENYYLNFGGGANFWPRISNSSELESGIDGSYAFYTSFGSSLSDSLENELEFTYRTGEVHGINPPTHPDMTLSADGNVIRGYSVHYNVKKYLRSSEVLSPYVAVGAGVTYVTINYEFIDSNRVLNDSDIALSGQFIAGTVLSVGNNLEFDVNYRYMVPFDMDVFWDGDEHNSIPAQNLNFVYDNHTVSIGLSFEF